MSGEHGFRRHDHFLLPSIFPQGRPGAGNAALHGPQGLDPSFCLDGSDGYWMPDIVSAEYDDGGSIKTPVGCGDARSVTAPVTPNFSMSSSSTDQAGGEEEADPFKMDPVKQEGDAEGGDSINKVSNIKPSRKKGERRQREIRVAFMTKSEVDHLEDGYRWRKYGQKAVKNSPFPRSYYRCTAQKCNVKKRVERSHQDPATVITTYEGQHTHHSPANARSSKEYCSLSHPPMRPSSFLLCDRLLHLQAAFPGNYSSYTEGHEGFANPSIAAPPPPPPLPLPPLNPSQLPVAVLPDQGLLQDMFLASFTS